MLYSGIHYPRVNRFGEQLKPSGVHYPRELRFGEQTETLRYTLPKRAQVWSQLKPSGIHYPKNGDELCCTRAIVTAKARLDQHPNWDGFKRGRRIQAEHAVDLHHETRVPRGPCGYDELRAFSLAPSLYDYQILLCNATRGYVVTSFGPPSQKQLVLHYNVITSLPGFFGTSYFCVRCLKPYDNQGQHACDNNPDHCSACLQTGCPDYTEARCLSLPAMQTCNLCRFMFYGTACFTNHVSKTQSGKTADHQQLSVCMSRRKCGNCRKLLVGRKQQQEHRCGYVTCPSCHHYVEALSHRCFIQVAKTPKEERAECRAKWRPGHRLRGAAARLATVHSNEDDVPSAPLPLLATGISVRTAWKLTRSPTNRFTAGAWTPIILASPWNGSTGNSTSYWMKTITSDMQAILASTGFLILGTW